jgi:predicted dehydrogenase
MSAPSIAVYGTDHAHVVELTMQLAEAGAPVRAVVATDDGIGPWLASQYPDARDNEPFADDVDIVVCAAIPSDRAQIAIEAMRAGKDVVLDKPGVTTPGQLDTVRAVQRETDRRYLVVFGERLGTPAMVCAHRLVAGGRIGRVLHTVGLGPHTLSREHRPKWFFDPSRYGGILVDIGAHQVDQFLSFTGAADAEVVASTVGAHPEHEGLQTFGEMLLRAPDGRTGYTRVDYYTPAGLGSWGDVRFFAVGTEGTVTARMVDNSVFLVDGEHNETIDASGEPIVWAKQFLAGEMPVDQAHVFTVNDVCLRAQASAIARPTG